MLTNAIPCECQLSELVEMLSRSEFIWQLAEFGYSRSADKCKEKFENIYKYHKRTKEGRAAKPGGKTYWFSNHLEALEIGLSLQPPTSENFQLPTRATVTSLTTTNLQTISQITANPASVQHTNTSNFISTSKSPSSSVEISDERKRKWSNFFENLTEQVVQKQESIQNKFMKTLEEIERQRTVREEAWRMQEMERVNREHEILIQEQLVAASRHASVIKFLEKISEEPNILQLKDSSSSLEKFTNIPELENGQSSMKGSSRWPKSEVQALITLRSALEHGYRLSAPKGSLWEAISSAMRKLGFNRSAQKCKEKWENMNKYFKKVKESNKARPENSKTCPYFHQLEALYKDKGDKISISLSPAYGLSAEDLVIHMMRRSKRQSELHQHEHVGCGLPTEDLPTEDLEGENVDHYYEEEGRDGDKHDEAKDDGEVGRRGFEFTSYSLFSV